MVELQTKSECESKCGSECGSKCKSSTECPIKSEIKNSSYVLIDDPDGDITFPKATIDPKLMKLQSDVTEFVTSSILKHEKEFYLLVQKFFPDKMDDILGTTCSSIIEMITSTTNKFYNQIYLDIQNKNKTPISELILQMCEYTDYGSHILLDKLIRLQFDAHIEISREELVLENNDSDLYEKSILNQLNVYLLSCNLLHILSKDVGDEIPFVNVPAGMSAFNIVIDKNIEN